MAYDDVDARVNTVSGDVVDAALRVHRRLGPGLLERVYHVCLAHELRKLGRSVEMEVPVGITYDDVHLDVAFRMDMRVDDAVVVEVKAVQEPHEAHFAQVLTYLKLTGAKVGLLLNFHAPILKQGIFRLVNPDLKRS